MASEPWAVVGCRDCDELWLVVHKRRQDESSCPRCGSTFPTKRLRSIKTAETREGAAEQRARILAARAGDAHRERQFERADYAVLEDEFWRREEEIHAANDDVIEQSLGHLDDRYEAFVDDAPFYADWFESAAQQAFVDRRDGRDPKPTSDRPPCEIATDGALVATQQVPAVPAATVTVDGPLTDVHTECISSEVMQDMLRRALADVDIEPDELRERFADAGVVAVPVESAGATPTHLVRELAVRASYDAGAREELLDLLTSLGKRSKAGFQTTKRDILTSYSRLFAAVEKTPTVAVRIPDSFDDLRADQRRDLCRYLTELGLGCDVRVVGSRVTLHKLAQEHPDELPAEFCEQCKGRQPSQSQIDARVAEAQDALDPDGRACDILRDLADAPAGTQQYAGIKAAHDVSASRVSALLSDLEELELIRKYGPRTDKLVDLTPAGKAFVDWLDSEIGRQQSIEAEFSASGNSSSQCRVNRAHEGGEAKGPYRTAYLDQSHHAAAVGLAVDGGIGYEAAELPEIVDHRTRYVSYDGERDEAVVAVRGSTPLQLATSFALALASEEFFNRVLPTDRLDDIDQEPKFLRRARNIGCLSQEALNDKQHLREKLLGWGEQLANMTTALHNGEYDDRKTLRREILKSAHGLAGSIVHICSELGIDVVREFFVPNLDDHEAVELSKTLATMIAIQSEYGIHVPYRHLFEDRKQKLQQALDLSYDAAEPTASLIGSIGITGPGADIFTDVLSGQCDPKEMRDDAPEIAVPLPIREASRSQYATAIARMLSHRKLQPKDSAVTILHAVTKNIATATRAVAHLADGQGGEIRLDEVRTAIASLSADDLLADLPPSAGQILVALARADDEVSQAELAERTGISTRRIRDVGDLLSDMGLISISDGYQIELPATSDANRLPAAVSEMSAPQDFLFEAVLTTIGDRARIGDPDDVIGAALTWPMDLESLFDELPTLRPWWKLACDLTNNQKQIESTAQLGDAPTQKAVVDYTPSATVASD